MTKDNLSSNQDLPEFTYEQIVEGKRPPVLSGPYIPAYLVRAEIERLSEETNKWQARAMALFYGGDLDRTSIGDIRRATDAYNRWLSESKAYLRSEGGIER